MWPLLEGWYTRNPWFSRFLEYISANFWYFFMKSFLVVRSYRLLVINIKILIMGALVTLGTWLKVPIFLISYILTELDVCYKVHGHTSSGFRDLRANPQMLVTCQKEQMLLTVNSTSRHTFDLVLSLSSKGLLNVSNSLLHFQMLTWIFFTVVKLKLYLRHVDNLLYLNYGTLISV